MLISQLFGQRVNMFIKTLVLFLYLSVAAAHRVPFYRRDYTYFEQFDAFYKLHYDPAVTSWTTAFVACDHEASVLFYPKTKDEWTVVKSLLASMKFKPNVTEVMVGIHDETGMGEFVTVEGLPTPLPLLDQYQPAGVVACVYMAVETGEYTLQSCERDTITPIVCKRVELPSCPTIDHEYTMSKEVNKCYKVNRKGKSWDAAKHTCFMEGGNLAVITNTLEAKTIKSKLPGESYFVGFRRLLPTGNFHTVTGLDFDSIFYQKWWTADEAKQECGAVRVIEGYNELYTTTRSCLNPLPFVCEMLPV